MADSDAVRQQRRRRHKAGDHSMCGRSCGDARARLRIAPVPAGARESLDPAAGLRDLAAQLQAAYASDPANAVLARELRQTLLALSAPGDRDADAEWAAMMADLARPVPADETERWLDGR